MENKYLAYLHYIWFTSKNLEKVFWSSSDYKNFFENFWYSDLIKAWIREQKANTILENKRKFNSQIIDKLIKDLNIDLISVKDPDYPEELKKLTIPPFLLYVRWNLRKNSNLISIVGSRKATKYSEIILDNIIPGLIKNDFWVVSGWAYWVDSLAHKITLKHWGYTISVIGTGIDIYYPFTNKALYEEIIKTGGAVVSIFPFKTIWTPYNFPIRNEIIAALSRWTLITEAGDKSWTLITARLALELNKDVFVIPWDITREASIWSNKLIQNWLGKPTMSYEDIIEEYWDTIKLEEKIKNIEFGDELEEKIYNFVLKEVSSAETIAEALDIEISIASYKLSMLEINWLISAEIWGNYRVVI